MLYAFVRSLKPKRYMEIGSGNSTRFVARAITDGGLDTRVISIDPEPRVEIEGLADQVIRAPLEATDLSVFSELTEHDLLFVDGSHRIFMNSDAVVFFLEVLPELPPGILVGVHDIYLPDDYDPAVAGRYYSEQYALAIWLLAGESVEPVFPAWYVTRYTSLLDPLDSVFSAPGLEEAERHGVSFWFRWRGRPD